jgi:Uma2 family endonuclease
MGRQSRHRLRKSGLTNVFLVVEVISPSTGRADRKLKRPVYQEHGIPQYWIIDGEQRHVEVWVPDAETPVIELERLVWQHPAIDEACVIESCSTSVERPTHSAAFTHP